MQAIRVVSRIQDQDDVNNVAPGSGVVLVGDGEKFTTGLRVQEVVANVSGTYQIDLATGTLFILTVTGNTTVTFNNAPASPRVASATVFLIQGGTGGYSVTFTGVDWGGPTPGFAAVAGTRVDLQFVARDGGASISGYSATATAGIADAVDASNYLRTSGAWVAAGTAALENNDAHWFQKTTIPTGQTVTIPAGSQMIVVDALTVDGTLVQDGTLVIIPSDALSAGENLADVDSAITARTNLGLGSSAVESVGTAAGNVVQLDGAAKLPAVDGSQLTNLPSAGASDVDDLTTTTGNSGEMVRVAAAGGLEYRTVAQVLEALSPGGALLITNSTADAVNKNATLTTKHYNNANADFAAYFAQAQSAANIIQFGGTNAASNTSATQLSFVTSGNNTTTTAPAERMRITASGLVGINETAPAGRLHVKASATNQRSLVLQFAASPTVPAFEVRNSAGAALTTIEPSGAFKPVSLDDASAENGTIYYSTTASKLVFKDSGGTVHPLY